MAYGMLAGVEPVVGIYTGIANWYQLIQISEIWWEITHPTFSFFPCADLHDPWYYASCQYGHFCCGKWVSMPLQQFIHLVSFQSIRLLTTNTLEKKRLKSIIFLTTYYLCTSSILGIKCHSNTWMHLFVFSLMIFLRGFKNENLHFDWWAKKHWS